MLRVDYKITYGEIKVRQKSDNRLVTIKIHEANALCAFIYHYKADDGTKMAQLVSFFADEEHIKNCEKNFACHDPIDLFVGEIVSVKLNLYYKESRTLLKYIIKHHEVKCYYKEEKK